MSSKRDLSFSDSEESFSKRLLLFGFKELAFSFKIDAFSACPLLNKSPISLANLFDSAKTLSSSD